jgi:hypothetical protein
MLNNSAGIVDSADGIATGYGLDGWPSISGRDKIFLLCEGVQGGSGTHPASYPINTGSSFPGVKPPEHEADHSPPRNAEVKHDDAIRPLAHTSSWHGTHSIKCRNNFSFCLFN